MQCFTIFQMKEPERILHVNPAKVLRTAGDLRERTVHDAALHGRKFISDQAVADRQPRAAAAVRQPPFRTIYILWITPAYFFKQKVRHFPGLFGQGCNMADSRTVDFRFHRGKYVMADAVTDGIVLRIGGILAPAYALAPERRFDLLPRKPQQRADELHAGQHAVPVFKDAHRPHGSKSLHSRAAGDAKKHALGQVIFVMRDGYPDNPPRVPAGLFPKSGRCLTEDFPLRVSAVRFPKACRCLTEDFAPCISSGLFQCQAPGSSLLRNPAVKQAERYVRLLTHFPHIFRIPVGFLPPDAVMDVHHLELQVQQLPKFFQEIKQKDRIRSARHPADHAVPVG